MARHLFIVGAHRLDLWDLWRRRFSEDPKIQVILDRRQGERRQRDQAPSLERRWTDRRSHQGIDRQIRNTGFAIIGPLP